MTTSGLPESWAVLPLGHIGVWNGGGTPTKSNPAFWNGDIPWASPKDVKVARLWDSSDHISSSAVEASTTMVIPKRSVLVVTRSGILAHTLPVATNEIPLAINQDLKAITPFAGIDAEFLAWALRALQRRILKECSKHGTTVHSIEVPRLQAFDVPLAPANEQRRIVAKIEELFSELDKGIESLKTARRQLEVYRQSVLKHAFEGKLTAQWREENKDKLETPEQLLARVKKEHVARYERELQSWEGVVKASKYSDKLSKKPAGPRKPEDVAEVSEDETVKLTRLPEGWLWIRVGSLLSERPANGRSVKDRLSGFPVLRLTAIRKEKLDLSEVKSGDWEREDALPYLVHEGDFLVARGNGSKGLVGRGALVPAVENDVAYPDTMIRLRVTPEVVGESFFSYVWNSHVLRRQIEGAARTTAGIYKINQGHILDFLIPLCSTGEQTVVVNQLSETLSAIDELEAEVDEQVSKFGPLRHAILKKAFAGQLVAQDPGDEPAAVLLEKIRTERAKAGKDGPTAKRNRKAKTAA